MDPETLAIIKLLAEAVAQKGAAPVQKDISGTPDAQSLFGAGGIFANFGIDNVVISAHMHPRGMDRLLPVLPNNTTNPLFVYLTGFEDNQNGAMPEGVCDDAPGMDMKVAHGTATFGRYSQGTREMEVNELMQVMNGHLTTDLRLQGSIFGPGHALLPAQVQNPTDALRYMLQAQMVGAGVGLQRQLNKQLWQGNPVNNAAGGGYMEFPGLDILIETGKIDAVSGVAVPSLDPDVKDFALNAVDGAAPDIVELLSMMAYYLQDNAERTGHAPVEWVIAMRPQLFWELTAVWPCRYLTNRCVTAGGANAVVINDDGYVRMRDDLRNNSYLIINGVRYPVVTDDGIFEHNAATNAGLNPGEFASDIYFVPLRAGGMPVTYWEHLDYTQAMAQTAGLAGRQWWATDGGRYMWAMQQQNYCFKLQCKIEPRVILRTPFLAGRLKNVKYTPIQHLREPDPASPYFKDGGQFSSTAPTYYSEWNPPE